VRAACDASLRRLGVDVIDLYQVHAPGEETPLEEPAPPPALYPHRMLVDQVGLSRMTLPLRRP
jgi:aryl-alcohol dehydrogenase-like predicted oxidoreductase